MRTKLLLIEDKARSLDAMMYAFVHTYLGADLDYDEKSKADDMIMGMWNIVTSISVDLEGLEKESADTEENSD